MDIHTYTRGRGHIVGGSPDLKTAWKHTAVETGNFVIYIKQVFALLGCYAALIVTDVSGHPMGPIFKGEDSLTLEDGTDRLSLNVSI